MIVQHLYDLAPWEWPEDAAETLLSVLRDRGADSSDRLHAAEMASSVTVFNDPLAEALLTVLKDPNEDDELRGQAAISLGPALEELDMKLGWDDLNDMLTSERVAGAIRHTLHEVYLDAAVPKYVRRRVLEASLRAPADWHAGAVRAAFHAEDDEWEQTAVFCMSYVSGFDDEIMEALESTNPELRYEAVRAAGNRGLKRAWRQVKSIVQREREDKVLLLAAIEAVAGIRPEVAAETLVDLMDHEDEDIADAVDEALALSDDRWDEEEDEW